LALAFVTAATSAAMNLSIVRPVISENAMQELQMLHNFALTGVILLSMPLSVLYIRALFTGNLWNLWRDLSGWPK